ncbi:MAG: 23S rRNA (guanosine(2251)-2'-O)-methyltransferase RlmB [Desulfotomaculaceae bacterium]|nr:23S rRNA (guanosine(2251)-2'-O)-methyltransferase RlmB [Desulfotomaculaceae bacterium]
MDDVIVGRNPVREALRAGRPINKIMVIRDSHSAPLQEIFSMARGKNIPVQRVERNCLNRYVAETVHQGVIALVSPKAYVAVEDIFESMPSNEEPLLILLDEISDPHNLGAILRTADAAGVHGVIIPRRRSAPLTPTVAKSSAGAIEYVPVARVANIAQTIETLKKKGVWLVGADVNAQVLLWDVQLDGPLALVIGGEDKGLGRLVKERCDILVRLPMSGQVNSLNASVAAALLIYEVVRQRRKAINHEGVSNN